MKLGMQVGFGRGHIVLDGDPAPPKGGQSPPSFGPYLVVAKWLDGSRCHLIWRKDSVQATLLDGDPASPPQKGQSPLPNFWPMSIVAKRLDGSTWHLA